MFLEDVLDTPSALRATADLHAAGGPLARLGSLEPRPRRVLFLGMGSSRFAAMTVAALLRSRGVDAAVEHGLDRGSYSRRRPTRW